MLWGWLEGQMGDFEKPTGTLFTIEEVGELLHGTLQVASYHQEWCHRRGYYPWYRLFQLPKALLDTSKYGFNVLWQLAIAVIGSHSMLLKKVEADSDTQSQSILKNTMVSI